MSFRNQQTVDIEPVTRRGEALSRVDENDFAAPPSQEFPTPRFEEDGPEANKVQKSKAPAVPPPVRVSTANSDSWIVKRGHFLSYIGIFIFTFILYFRPYELFPALSSFSSMAMIAALLTLAIFIPSQFALEGNLTARPREVNLLLLLTLAALISIPVGTDPAEGWATFNDSFVKAVLMFIVMVNVVRTDLRLMGLIWISLGVGCLLSLNAIDNFRAGNFTIEGYRVEGDLGGMFGNPNDMALHLVTMIPLAVAFMMNARNAALKFLYAGCAVLMVAGTVVTFSRGGFLGLVISGAVLAWKFGRGNRIPVTLVCAVVIVAFLAFAPGGYGNRLWSLFDSNLDAVGSSSARTELLKRSIVVAIRHPLFGVGMGNFHIFSIQEHVSHNAYTQVAAEMGMAALAFYTLFIVTPLKRLWQIERETFEKKRKSRFYYLAVGMQASLVAYMVASFFASVAYQWYVYYLVAFAIGLRRIYDFTYDPEKQKADADAAAATKQGQAINQGDSASRGVRAKLGQATG